MPVCGYVVIPRPGALDEAVRELSRIDGCEPLPARNSEILLLVTEAETFQADLQLRARLDQIPAIQALLLTFGEIDPEAPVADPVRESRS